MTSPALSHRSHANGNCLYGKGQIEAKNINAIFSDAIRVAKSLNIAIQKMCPYCLKLIQEALSEEGGQQGYDNRNTRAGSRRAKPLPGQSDVTDTARTQCTNNSRRNWLL